MLVVVGHEEYLQRMRLGSFCCGMQVIVVGAGAPLLASKPASQAARRRSAGVAKCAKKVNQLRESLEAK